MLCSARHLGPILHSSSSILSCQNSDIATLTRFFLSCFWIYSTLLYSALLYSALLYSALLYYMPAVGSPPSGNFLAPPRRTRPEIRLAEGSESETSSPGCPESPRWEFLPIPTKTHLFVGCKYGILHRIYKRPYKTKGFGWLRCKLGGPVFLWSCYEGSQFAVSILGALGFWKLLHA